MLLLLLVHHLQSFSELRYTVLIYILCSLSWESFYMPVRHLADENALFLFESSGAKVIVLRNNPNHKPQLSWFLATKAITYHLQIRRKTKRRPLSCHGKESRSKGLEGNELMIAGRVQVKHFPSVSASFCCPFRFGGSIGIKLWEKGRGT